MDLADAASRVEQIQMGQSIAGLPAGLRIAGIIPVHVGGLMMNIDLVRDFASRHGLWIIEDAAHAYPAAWRRSRTDSWVWCGQQTAAVSCFSFYANKTITTGAA